MIQKYSKHVLVLVFMIFSDNHAAQDTLQINRAQLPTIDQIEKEQKAIRNRNSYRYAVITATSIGIIAALHTAHEAASYFNTTLLHEVRLQKVEAKVQADGTSVAPAKTIGWIEWIKNGVKDATFSSMASYVVSNVFSSSMIDYCKNKWKDLFEKEHVVWYVENQTKIWQLLADLKNYSVEYDMYSELLNIEALNQDAKLHIKAFTDELVQAVKDRESDDVGNEGWFAVMFSGLKKKYAKQGLELEKLQDAIMPYVAQRKRAELEGFDNQRLFNIDDTKRQEVVNLCSLLAKEIQKTTAFLAIKMKVESPKIKNLIALTNEYLDYMQQLVHMGTDELQVVSKAQKGMFTCTYEFEKLLKDQVTHIYRYTKLIQ